VDVSGGSTANHLVTGLQSGISYNITVVATSQHLPSEGVATDIKLNGLDDFQAVASEREVTFSWSAPSVSTPITGYTLSCSPPPSSSSLPRNFTSPGTYNVTGFYPGTSYSCSLEAYNMDSRGPPAIVLFTTNEDYSQFQLILKGPINCIEWVADDAFSKQEDIVSDLENMCQCRFNKSNVDEESFAACNDHFSEYVTFRARLSGTSDNDSEYLVSLLAKWVSTSPKISVDGLEMKVTNNELNCTVFLSGHNDRDCVSELSRNNDVELAVILPSVFGILVAAIGVIATIVLAVLALMKHHEQRNNPVPKQPAADKPVPEQPNNPPKRGESVDYSASSKQDEKDIPDRKLGEKDVPDSKLDMSEGDKKSADAAKKKEGSSTSEASRYGHDDKRLEQLLSKVNDGDKS
jgi:hypothetical protein